MNNELNSAIREALTEVSKREKVRKLAVSASDITLKKGTTMIQISYYDGNKIVIEPLLIWSS